MKCYASWCTYLPLVAASLLVLLAQAGGRADTPQTPRPAWTTSRLQGTPEPPESYRIVSAFPQLRFQKPTSLEEIPGTDRLLVTEMAGRVLSFPRKTDVARTDLVVDLRALLPADLADRGVSLFDAELHPKFAQNRQLFVCYVHPGSGGHTRVSRFTVTDEAVPRATPGSEQVVITWPSGGHNGGCLEFGKDGLLYISTGDGSGPNPPDGLTTGQDISDLLGSILRIDVDVPGKDTAYSIPTDNPFVGRAGARPEIWAYGLRNPWKFGIDPVTGDTFVADNGWESWEMVHRIGRGSNCGWPVMEGRAALRTEVPVGPTPIVPPAADHPHTEANSVIGGPVYRGSKLPGLIGSFVYGDYITGTIWALRPDKDGAYVPTTLVDTDQQIVAFTQCTSGELYVLDYDFSGQIFELLPSDVPDRSATFPRRLSETGLFTSLATLEPAPGVVPYDVRVNRWVDGATAQRWVAIPADGRIRIGANPLEASEFPDGTVLVQQLTLPGAEGRPIRLETQLLHFEAGAWRPYSYLWDDAGHDAELVSPLGANRPIRVADALSTDGSIERTWHVNARNECKLCHNAGARFVLGFVANQLDRPVARGADSPSSQLALLAAQGVIAAAPRTAADDPWRLVDPHDKSQRLEDRARSYLHANCSMCHHAGGNAIVSFYLRRDLPFEKLNTNKGTGIGTFGMREAKIIAPGDPFRSVLVYRMSKLGYARMPYIGSQLVDGAGVALVAEWIQGMRPAEGATLSAPATRGSPEDQALRALADSATLNDAQRQQSLGTLAKSTEGTLALTSQLHGGRLAPALLPQAVKLGAASTSSDVRGLFDTFVPESQRRPTLGAHILPQTILDRTGDRQRGKLIYYSDGARCKACHEIDDRNRSLGPTLQEINKKYPRPAELLQHVLQPSLKIDEPFASYTVETDDGRTLVGLVERQTDQEVVLRTIEKRTIRIARGDIVEFKKGAKSLMPDLVLADLTAQEAADLLEYIRSLGTPAP